MSPEIIEQWLSEFIKAYDTPPYLIFADGKWRNPVHTHSQSADTYNLLFEVWFKSRQAMAIKIPKRALHRKADQSAITSTKSGFNMCIDEIKKLIQSQGYQVEG